MFFLFSFFFVWLTVRKMRQTDRWVGIVQYKKITRGFFSSFLPCPFVLSWSALSALFFSLFNPPAPKATRRAAVISIYKGFKFRIKMFFRLRLPCIYDMGGTHPHARMNHNKNTSPTVSGFKDWFVEKPLTHRRQMSPVNLLSQRLRLSTYVNLNNTEKLKMLIIFFSSINNPPSKYVSLFEFISRLFCNSSRRLIS